MQTQTKLTKSEAMKEKIAAILMSYIAKEQQDIESGIEEGIYHEADNVERLEQMAHETLLVQEFLKTPPAIYIYVEGGNIQGISATEPMEVNIYDKDNLENDEDRYIEEAGTPEAWDEMINKKTEAGEIMGIF